MVQGIVFDMDGVLTDSERAWIACFDGLVESYGKHFDKRDYKELFGCSREVEDQVISRVLGVSEADAKALKDTWVDNHSFNYAELAIDETFRLARALKARGLKIAIASSSERQNVERMLAETGTADIFDVVVAGNDVREAKPSPDAYLKAAECLGILPADLLAVDDSLIGVQAAVTAGMTVFQLSPAPEFNSTLPEVKAVCSSPAELEQTVLAYVDGAAVQ